MPDSDRLASTRAVYDQSADRFVDAVGTTIDPSIESVLDRSMLDAFADKLTLTDPGLVLDVGCGPGRAAAYLTDRGLSVSGIDLSATMVQAARTAHPEIRFEQGSLMDLGVPDATLAGAVCWYSIIHTPINELNAIWIEMRRALRPAGLLLIGFQAGSGERLVRQNAHGTDATLVSFRHDPEVISESLEAAGFEIVTRVWRVQELDHESTPQAFLLARSTGH